MTPRLQLYGSYFIKSIVKAALLYGAMYAIFRYGGHFSAEQSSLLALVDGALIWYLVSEEKKKERLLHPFRVTIEPNWYDLFLEFKILDEQGLDALRKHRSGGAEEHYEPCHDVLRDGVTFTVLKPDLIYSNDWCAFLGSVDLAMEIKEITGPTRIEPEYRARFRVRTGEDGYELGIKTAESVQQALDRSEQDEQEAGLIRIATLPYEEFWPYYGLKQTEKTERRREQVLKQHGWKREEEDELADWPVQLEHKYFTVYHDHIRCAGAAAGRDLGKGPSAY